MAEKYVHVDLNFQENEKEPLKCSLLSTWTWKGLGHLENFACMYIEDASTLGEKEES